MPLRPHVCFTELLKFFQMMCKIMSIFKFAPVLLLTLFILILKVEACVDIFEGILIFIISIL